MSRLFHCKQFSISDEDCGMKIGTDAVLLGAWTDTTDCKSILDIGTGSGILALMLAQKSTAQINAIEIDTLAAKTAENNFLKSNWKSRLQIFNLSLDNFIKSNSKTYDLIISNPPFFKNSLLSEDVTKNIAKHDVSLTYEELIRAASFLLNPTGKLSVILPYDKKEIFSDICKFHNLKCFKITTVIPVTNKKPNRILMQWLKTGNPINCIENTLTIRLSNDIYTADYIGLTKDYLLNS